MRRSSTRTSTIAYAPHLPCTAAAPAECVLDSLARELDPSAHPPPRLALGTSGLRLGSDRPSSRAAPARSVLSDRLGDTKGGRTEGLRRVEREAADVALCFVLEPFVLPPFLFHLFPIDRRVVESGLERYVPIADVLTTAQSPETRMRLIRKVRPSAPPGCTMRLARSTSERHSVA